MKKTATIFLALFYVILATDLSVAIHKCMGSVQSISLSQSNEICCCGDINSDGCCENETVDFPEESENKVTSSFTYHFVKSISGIVEFPTQPELEQFVAQEYEFAFHDLPPPESEAVYLLYCSLTYYG